MSLYPDLSLCGINFLDLTFHASGGLEVFDEFWEGRGLDRSKERLLFGGYKRRGQQHTVWISWVRSHDECTDVRIGLEVSHPSKKWPHRHPSLHRLKENDLRDFLAVLAEMTVPWGLKSRFAVHWAKSLDSMYPNSQRVRAKSLSIDVFDEAGKLAMNVTYERRESGSLAIVAPSGAFEFPPASNVDTFFQVPYDTACSIAGSLGTRLKGDA